MITRNKGQLQKSNNPNNPNCSSIIQCLLDMSENNFPAEQISLLLEFAKKNKDKLSNAEKLFHSHQYPDGRIQFYQGTRNTEHCRYLTPNAIVILDIMLQNMRSNNLIELSLDDIVVTTSLSKSTAKRALAELKKNGCIAIKFKHSKVNGTVYMINPEIGIVGKINNRSNMQTIFWKLTGTTYKSNENLNIVINKYSEPHNNWIKNNNTRTYSRGYDKQDTTEGHVYFNKINEPKINIKEKSSSANELQA